MEQDVRTRDEEREIEKKVLEECKEPTNATDEDVNVLINHEIPQTRTAKCLVSCAQEKVGIVSYTIRNKKFAVENFLNYNFQLVNGRISIDGIKAIGEKKYGENEKVLAIFNEIAGECTSVTGFDACELSGNLVQCMHKALKKRGLSAKKGIPAN